MPLEFMGDNCFKLLKKISDEKDIIVCSSGPRRLFSIGEFNKLMILNKEYYGKIINNKKELLSVFFKLSDLSFGEYSIDNRIIV